MPHKKTGADIQALIEPATGGRAALLMTVSGTFHAFVGILTPLFTADAVDYEEYHSAARPDGVFASGQTVIQKLSTGVSSLIGGAVYAVAGFSGGRVEEINRYISEGGLARANPTFRPYMTALFFMITIPTVVGALLPIIPTWKYPLSDAEHGQMLEELQARRRG